jgi:hypothetical protein
MTIQDFRLSRDQGDDSFVVVLADDGRTRVVTRVARNALDDYFQRRELTHRQRIALVESNLAEIGRLIVRKYAAGDTSTYTDRLGITDDSNKLIVITYDDLRCGEPLSDARLYMEEKAGFSGAFSGT